MPKGRPTKRTVARKKADPAPPKVFLSHASEDKDRFVVDFATRLRRRGVDVWLDRWEMLPGDSLVRKIFDEGLGRADAIIVVISKHSLAKPWVQEELDIAMVRKINSSSRLIPVVIDDCAVPACLQATVWEKISDLKNYEPALDRVVLSIFGRSEKPPVGAGPAFSSRPGVIIGELTRVDSLVLQTACEMCLERKRPDFWVSRTNLTHRTEKLGVGEEAAWESVRVLKSRGYLQIEMEMSLQITFAGFEAYLKAHRPDYDKLLKKFASLVINEELWEGKAIEKAMPAPCALVEHIVEVFREKHWLNVVRFGSGGWEIVEGTVSPELKRWLEA